MRTCRVSRHAASITGRVRIAPTGAPVPAQQLPRSDRRADWQVDPVVRHRWRGEPQGGVLPRSRARAVVEPGQDLREPHHPGLGDRRSLSLHAWRHSRLRRRYRERGAAFPHHSAPGRVRYETWPPDVWRYVAGANTWGELTVDPAPGIVFVPTGSPTYDFLWRRPHWRESLRDLPRCRARCAHRQARVALPDGAPRFVGLRQHSGARPHDDPTQRQTSGRRGAGRKDGISLRLQPGDWLAHLADRRTSCGQERCPG